MSLMDTALARVNAHAGLTPSAPKVTGAPIVGPANAVLPGGGLGLDGAHAARQQAFAKFQALQANPAAALRQLGEEGYIAALQEAKALALQADTAFRAAATAQGLGMFTEAPAR